MFLIILVLKKFLNLIFFNVCSVIFNNINDYIFYFDKNLCSSNISVYILYKLEYLMDIKCSLFIV